MTITTLSKKRLFAYIIADEIQVEDEVINKAKGNDADSLSKIADIYYEKKDYSKAMDWYQLAASENNAHSQWSIGEMYYNGEGVPKDHTIAMEWYLKAHKNGYTRATSDIGFLYYRGLGVKQDYSIALKWFLEAANKGNKVAQCRVGTYYENGYGVEIDKKYALEWYEKSAEQGYGIYYVERLNKEGIYIDASQKRCIQMEKDIKEHKEIIMEQKERIHELENKLKLAEQEKDNEMKLLWREIKALKLSQRVKFSRILNTNYDPDGAIHTQYDHSSDLCYDG